MRHYCTYFDTNYMLRGLTMFRSLQAHEGDFVLWVLCCDDASFGALQTLNVPNLRPIRLSQVEAHEPRLAAAKAERSFVEYLWTLSPIWPLYLFQTKPEIESLTYLDADQFFYGSPQPIFDEIGDSSISVFSHRYSPADAHMNVNGVYNVGWVGFRRDETGLQCLERWAQQCLEWCFAYTDEGRYGDQKYLDEWPERYDGVCEVKHAGAGIAPWNWMNCEFALKSGELLCDGTPLIFFHFHGLRIFNSWLYDTFYTSRIYGKMPAQTRRWLFNPYLEAMTETARWARGRGCKVDFGYLPFRKYMVNYGVRTFLKKVARRQFVVHLGLK